MSTRFRSLTVCGAALAALTVNVTHADPSPVASIPATPATVVSYTGVAVGPVGFDDSTSGLSISCNSSTIVGLADVGGSPPIAPPIELQTLDAPNSTWSGCGGSVGLDIAVAGQGTWNFSWDTYNGSDVTTGRITDVNAHVSSSDGGTCGFDVTGVVNATFTNSSQNLAISPDATLSISNVSGCFGLINDGDQGSMAATYNVTTGGRI